MRAGWVVKANDGLATVDVHVQLIDAAQWYQPLRKNLGKKNCELGEADIRRICDVFLELEETDSVPEASVVEVLRRGYLRHGEPLRHANVKVARPPITSEKA